MKMDSKEEILEALDGTFNSNCKEHYMSFRFVELSTKCAPIHFRIQPQKWRQSAAVAGALSQQNRGHGGDFVSIC